MARGINKAIIVGNLGGDPDVRYTSSGTAVANLSIATTYKPRTDGDEVTEWHRVVMFGKLAEISGEYLRKGSQVYLEGRLQTRKWTDKSGVERYTTEIIANEMQMLGGKNGANSGQTRSDNAAEQTTQPPADDFDDDIPF